MQSFYASYRNELSKLMSRKKYIVFFCIGVAICIIWTVLGRLITNFATRQQGFASMSLVPTPMGTLPLFLQVIVPFLMFMGLTDLITVEGSDGTMKAMICCPVERWKLYASKLVSVLTYGIAYLVGVYIVCAAANQIFGSPQSIPALLTALASYTLTIVPLAVLAAFAALVALWGRSGTLTMFILLFAYIILNALPMFFPVLSEMLFTSYLNWYRLWIGALPDASKMIHMLLIVLGYGVVFFTAGSLIFDKKEY
jgi:ABC-2 type transport system permease protein